MTSRSYCFTSWKPITYTVTAECDIRYLCYGIEICPKTQKQHYQGYLELRKPLRMQGVKKLLDDNTIHLEKRKGTRDQARDYCKKDGKFYEYGTWTLGKKTSVTLKTTGCYMCDSFVYYAKRMSPQCKILLCSSPSHVQYKYAPNEKTLADNDFEPWQPFR